MAARLMIPARLLIGRRRVLGTWVRRTHPMGEWAAQERYAIHRAVKWANDEDPSRDERMDRMKMGPPQEPHGMTTKKAPESPQGTFKEPPESTTAWSSSKTGAGGAVRRVQSRCAPSSSPFAKPLVKRPALLEADQRNGFHPAPRVCWCGAKHLTGGTPSEPNQWWRRWIMPMLDARDGQDPPAIRRRSFTGSFGIDDRGPARFR
ncbi:hypothetical protein EDB80DRAFT_720228 [Ilyonectria destructans]|nr:hypothetical protein EDB80DRAFT_720228 [Ilyonectria destructans]